MEQPSKSVNSSPEATDEQEEAGFVGEEVDLRDVLSTEVEIKEEEIELDEQTFLPADDTPDPIASDTVRDSPESLDEDVKSGRNRKENSDSSTESADESVKHEKVNLKKRKGKPQTAVKRKKSRNKPKFNGMAMPRFVPGMMVERKKKHLCLECGHQFDSIFLFATHTKQFHLARLNGYPYDCFYCPRMFQQKLALQRHLLFHSRFEPLRCPICRASFYSALGMASHVASHQTQALRKKPEVVQNFKNSIYSRKVTLLDNVCFVCGAAQDTEDDLMTHVTSHRGLLQCKACYEMVPSPAELLDHVQTVHNNQAELTYYGCPLEHCPRSFLSAADMRKHSQTCVPPKQSISGTSMQCDICGLTYFEVDHFVTHMRLHGALSRESSGPSQCKLCAFTMKSPGEQAIHMLKQHGYRDRLESLAEAYGKLNILPPEEASEGSEGG
uniref:C2H2-type domain-containing protein n=1 Tax=Culex tarsalis TaxID=7177 RepID=A0A1Q3F333_CULTA